MPSVKLITALCSSLNSTTRFTSSLNNHVKTHFPLKYKLHNPTLNVPERLRDSAISAAAEKAWLPGRPSDGVCLRVRCCVYVLRLSARESTGAERDRMMTGAANDLILHHLTALDELLS